ncbi:NAD(P)-binding protein [Aspergillus steynii IBT 23096]|uniref:NAD(P)-binding protein n=1 Tax=Aspergillus steynii IBT 23096 TaxID=1392250 RepID=A0A2I2FRV6_9EURO|nr:NAD(P)-binding protein [Aspergillus steynii IBT 23096]PLB43351.1 NAD(P)-binding protein [Aspergillus steynii IBT 23096]
MSAVKVALVGASGETGQSIVNGLLGSQDTKFDIVALTRPESLEKPANTNLKERGVKIVPADLRGPQDEIVKLLSGIDIVISAIYFGSLADEVLLANAAKIAGVKRFVQSAFMIILPPRGVVDFREQKENNLGHIQSLHLPYTYIDVGWWYQLTLPRLPSGRIDYALPKTQDNQVIGLDGNIPSALADIRDVGRYVARIITDPRTLNKKVHVYNEIYTRNQVYEVLERHSGEKIPREYISENEVNTRIEEARTALNKNHKDGDALSTFTVSQLFRSWGIRGENTPEYAAYLGYLNGKDLYPDFEFTKFEDYVKEVLEGKVKGVYQTKK